jgi:mannosyltransferase
VLYLANIASNASNTELQQSLSSLQSVFLSKHRQYPVVVAYDQEDERFLTPDLQGVLRGSVPESQLDFAPIRRFRHIPWPFSMYAGIYREENPYYSRVGYRYMCRYWAHTVFSQPFMRNVTSYLRLDTDTFLVEMPVDPFAILARESQIAYLGSVMYKESPVSTTGLWETFLRFARDEQIHPWGLTPLSRQGVDGYSDKDIREMPSRDAIDVLFNRGYNLDYYYNNWEASRVDAWTSPVYQRLAKHIDAAGGIVVWRWGDAPIRTLSLFLLRDTVASRQYRGLRVYHKAYHATAGAETREACAT